jgi:hypothetical protein
VFERRGGMENYHAHVRGGKVYDGLDPFQQWMARSNMKTIREQGVSVEHQTAVLRANGYPSIANAVEELYEQDILAPKWSVVYWENNQVGEGGDNNLTHAQAVAELERLKGRGRAAIAMSFDGRVFGNGVRLCDDWKEMRQLWGLPTPDGM